MINNRIVIFGLAILFLFFAIGFQASFFFWFLFIGFSFIFVVMGIFYSTVDDIPLDQVDEKEDERDIDDSGFILLDDTDYIFIEKGKLEI